MEDTGDSGENRATKVVASTLAILVGLAGIQHGIFEIFQGNVKPETAMIDAIGPGQRFWEHGIETALTIIPSFLISGILAMVVGLLVVVWARTYINRRFGAIVLLLLSITLFLVGGGFAPIFLTILAFATATRINKPLRWWRSILPGGIRRFLAWLWPWSLIASVFLFAFSVEIAIFGYPLLWFFDADTTFNIQYTMAYIMLILTILTVPIGFAHDIQSRPELSHA